MAYQYEQQAYAGHEQQPQQQQQQPQQQQQQQQQQVEPTIFWSWDAFPPTRLEAARMVIPLGCMHAPLGPMQVKMPPLQTEPIRCRGCTGILNPYCQVDFRSKAWTCPLCNTRSSMPQQYSNISESNMPTELYQQCTTVEYRCADAISPPPFFLFVIDLCVGSADPTDLAALRDILLKACNWLPSNAHVGIITYGTCVSVHEIESLQTSDITKVHTLKGCKSYSTADIIKLLRLPVEYQQPKKGKAPIRERRAVQSKFFSVVENAEAVLSQIFEGVQVDPWPVPREHRQRRCTGAALSVATALADALYPGVGGRIMLFLSGPCTEGPGLTVEPHLGNMLRGHTDIKNDAPSARHWAKSKEFYDGLSTRVIPNGHVVDAFLNALDQVGFAEMRSCVALTGGTCVLADSFKNPKFLGSFQKFFRRNEDGQLNMAFNAKVEVVTSSQWKVAGATGPVISTGKKGPSVHTDSEMGVGGTSEWAVSAMDDRTTLAFFFEVVNMPSEKVGDFRFVQFSTRYVHTSGETRLRVTTCGHRIAPAGSKDLGMYFRQTSAAVLMARLSAHKAEEEHLFDVLRWLDRHLIKLVSRFAQYEQDKPATLRLCDQMSLFPGFMFHLRRSPFLQVFNSSPDETCFFRLWLDRESVEEALVMLQPALFAFSLQEGGPRPVLLDSSSVTEGNILVLDTYFEVVVHYGQTVVQWRGQGYQERADFAHFGQLLDMPREFAQGKVKHRYPEPRYVECDHHGSQARLLYNVINPSVTHKDDEKDGQRYGAKQGEIVYTDDAPMSTFMDHLKKLAVQN